VLEGVNLTVSEGEFICVIGHSGCGKSTLLNMVAGFNTPTNGKVQRLKPITQPGPDRWWCSRTTPCCLADCFENIYIAVNAVNPQEVEGREDSNRAGASGNVGLADAADNPATLRWNETAGFNRTSLGNSSQSVDSG